MTEDTAVSAVEAGMLAENRSDPPVQNIEKAPPQPPSLKQKKPQTSGVDADTVKTSSVAAPSASLISENEPGDIKTGMKEKLKKILPNTNSILFGALFLGLLLCVITIFFLYFRLSAFEKSLSDMKAEYSKNVAEQEKRFSAALHEKTVNDLENRKKSVAIETLNKLRGGLTERRLIRKSDGDWYVVGNRDEAVGNPEVIEILNNAYQTAKSAERAGQVVPPHTGNAVVVLKPDGKGGTQVRTAYDFIVGGK